MSTLDTYFAQFIRERIFLNNVTPKTREWYTNVLTISKYCRHLRPMDTLLRECCNGTNGGAVMPIDRTSPG